MRTLLFTLITFSFIHAGGGVLDIEWPAPNQAQQKSMANYPKVLKEGIKEVRLPVYLSSQYIYDKSMVVVADKNFYSISFTLQGASILFEGDRTYQEAVSPDNPEFQKIAKKIKPVEYSSSEEMMIAQYQRHGANYNITVECDKPESDERCTDEKFIRKLYQSLKMVGGRP
jgi:hypothetical protein